MKKILRELSEIYGREIKENDHIILYELDMANCKWTTENAKIVALRLLKDRKIFENDMDGYLLDTIKYAPCDNEGNMIK